MSGQYDEWYTITKSYLVLQHAIKEKWFWLIDWLTNWLTDWVSWLIDWLVDWVTDWLNEWLGWLSNRLTEWVIGLSNWLIEWLVDWVTDWLTEWLVDLMIGWLSEWVSEWVCDWLIHSKMPTVRNARSLVTSREMLSGLQIWMKSPLNALFSVGIMNADTDSASPMLRYTYVWRVQQWTTSITSWVKFQNSNGKEL